MNKRDAFETYQEKGNLKEMSPMMEEEIMDIETGIQAGCTTNTFSLSDFLGNTGGWCTATKECMPSCN
ncbi:lichenicidin alpha family lanthipeptide [Enterococcus gallinarum]|uniref:lichenicidin alpha family lanthipeptide n=1 Tax=Enterococcus gallinarum TaxID=1353 RepID=UPI001E414040|nr:lichenicidin alpha family lanthipeptide [Enterococcus gallinarum]MCR1928448.1 lichenicidin alpha family lanthipeptide [Enterococcus gallinarum]MCR1930296.1 lichenicidin alpha family lanthipeptide [Enterococcus gallinarum]MCR1945451.1 lichenicidin alpha family lanthipeptide [Enterococcus gallinarum]